jgi:cell division protein FtsZ
MAYKPEAKQNSSKPSQGHLFTGFSFRDEEEATSNELKNKYDHFKKQAHPQHPIKNNRRNFQSTKHGSGALPLPFDSLEEKKQVLHEKAQNRIKELAKQQATELSEEALRDYLDIPAYLRKDIQLEERPSIDDKNIIRHYLNEQSGRDRDIE